MKIYYPFILALLLCSCSEKQVTVKPVEGPITESVYASGIVKSLNQYQAYTSATGIISEVYVSEGDMVKRGDAILNVSNTAQRLNRENAQLTANYTDPSANSSRLNDARNQMEVAESKLQLDSILYMKQQALFKQQVGTETELEQKALNYENAKAAAYAAKVKYNELKRQVKFNASQALKSLQISTAMESDYTLRSDIDGRIYQLNRNKGEVIGPQTPVALIGDAKTFILIMQVDENDIVKILKGMEVLVSFDSYAKQVFTARISKINPMMNERTKTFEVEALFENQPDVLFPGMSFEASIILKKKEQALLISRSCLFKDSLVIKKGGDTTKVVTGLMDYQMVEILSGISTSDELILPIK